MREFRLKKVDEDRAENLKADLRMRMFFILRKAFKERSDICNFRNAEFAQAVGKDAGYVSRLLSGKSGGITAETLTVMLDALDTHLRIEAVPRERMNPTTYDFRPQKNRGMKNNAAHNAVFSGTVASSVVNHSPANRKFKQDHFEMA